MKQESAKSMKNNGFDKRKEKAVLTRSSLYAAADRLFAQYGFDEVSVDSIVEEAGVSKGAFYVHFGSKDTLVATLIADKVGKVDTNYQAFLNSLPAGMTSADTLLALVGNIFDVIENQLGIAQMRALYRMQLAGESHAENASAYNRAVYGMVEDVLRTGIQRGEFHSSQSLDDLSRHLLLAMRGITYEWCIRYPDFPLKKQALAHFKLLLSGLVAHP